MDMKEFFSEHSHVNPITGCIIWDGDFVKPGVPVVSVGGSGVQVRKMLYESINGTQPYRTKFLPLCENEKCVKIDHISLVLKEQQPMEVDEEKLNQAVKLRDEGYRLDTIGKKLGVTASAVSKWLKYHAAQTEEPANED